MSHWRLALAAVGLFGLGALVGRTMVPPRVVSVEKMEEVKAAAKAEAAIDIAKATKAKSQKLDIDQSFLQDWHWTYRPDGTLADVTASSTKNDKRKEATASKDTTEHTAAKTSAEQSIKYLYKETKIEAPRLNWAVEVRAGADLNLRPSYEVEVARRLFGNVSATASVNPKTKTAFVGLQVRL